MNNTINSRIKEIRREFCGGSNVEFAKQLGKEPNTTSNWVRDGYSVGGGVASEISSKFPVSLEWILKGSGDMLIGDNAQQIGNIGHMSGGAVVSGSHNSNIGNIGQPAPYGVTDRRSGSPGDVAGVPYYDVDFIAGFDGVENDQTVNPAYYIQFPQYAKADSWVNATGHSMQPLINHGDMIAIKKLEDWDTYLLYGEVYAIVTNEYRTIKYVRKSAKGDEYLRLIPANGEFDEQDIPKSVVRGVFQILGCAKRIF
jgi:hypothetical protein